MKATRFIVSYFDGPRKERVYLFDSGGGGYGWHDDSANAAMFWTAEDALAAVDAYYTRYGNKPSRVTITTLLVTTDPVDEVEYTWPAPGWVMVK